MFAVSLTFEGVVKVDGGLLRYVRTSQTDHYLMSTCSVSPRRRNIMFSTQNPPAVQRMPWPSVDDSDSDDDDEGEPRRRTMTGHDTWILNDQDLPWLEDANGGILSCELIRVSGYS